MNIGIIGCGNMGAAIARRIEGKYALGVCDKDPSKLGGIAGEVLPAADLVHKSAIVILAVKPQDFSDLLEPIKKTPGAQNRLFISIAAGITTAYIQQNLETRFIATQQAKEWLTGQLEDLKAKVERAYEALQAFGSKHDIISL